MLTTLAAQEFDIVNSEAVFDSVAVVMAGGGSAVEVGLGRIVALHYRSSTLYQIRLHIRNLYF